MPPLDAVLQHLASDTPHALERLKAFLAIPSVSTDPAYKPHIHRAAAWVTDALTQAGLTATVHPTAGHPVVLAHSRPDAAPPNAPRVLFYGHYDVQPPDPLDLWTSPPFEPAIRDGKIFARGAEDNKGQVCTFIEALRAWNTVNHGKLPVHVSVLIEGEEECGSAGLHGFLQQHQAELAPPRHHFVLISDTHMWNRQTPAITYALRGMAYFDVQLHGPSRDLHSGMYGGTLANPATLLTQILGRLFDANQHVTIPGFYDDVLPLSPEEKQQWASLAFDERKYLGDVGAIPFGEKGFDTLERRWARPSCDLNGLYGGYGGPGGKTVIPSFAGAKVSFRLAPNQSSQKISAQFHHWLQSHDTHGCRWKITQVHGAEPVISPTDSPWIAAAQRALRRTAGRPAVLIREGATIPVVSDFKQALGLDSLMLGFGLDDDCIHSPNEKFDLACFDLGCRTHAALLAELAAG